MFYFNSETLPYQPGIVRPFPSVTAPCQPSAASILEPGSSIYHCASPSSQGLPTMSFLLYKTKKKYLGQELLSQYLETDFTVTLQWLKYSLSLFWEWKLEPSTVPRCAHPQGFVLRSILLERSVSFPCTRQHTDTNACNFSNVEYEYFSFKSLKKKKKKEGNAMQEKAL